MERTDIIKSVYDLKCEVLDEIRKVLPNGTHYFVQPFFIHYVEGEVANTEVCIAIEVVKEDEQMVRVHHQSEGYGAEDIDITDGDEIFNYEPNSFADILGNLKAEIRGKKLSVLRNLIEQNGGRMQFDGSLRFCGIAHFDDGSTFEHEECYLNGISIENGNMIFHNTEENDPHNNEDDFISDAELDRIIEYVRNQSKQKFSIKVNASRIFEIEADTYEDALEMAQAELKANPFYDGDIDYWERQ